MGPAERRSCPLTHRAFVVWLCVHGGRCRLAEEQATQSSSPSPRRPVARSIARCPSLTPRCGGCRVSVRAGRRARAGPCAPSSKRKVRCMPTRYPCVLAMLIRRVRVRIDPHNAVEKEEKREREKAERAEARDGKEPSSKKRKGLVPRRVAATVGPLCGLLLVVGARSRVWLIQRASVRSHRAASQTATRRRSTSDWRHDAAPPPTLLCPRTPTVSYRS